MSDPIEDGIARLLRETGARPPAPPERSRRVEEELRAHWRRTVASRRRARLARVVAIAASVVVALLAWVSVRRPAPVATVERGAPTALGPGAVLATAQAERVAIRTGSRHSVRLDTRSRVRLLSDRALVLESGAVYVDSGGPQATAAPLEIRTPLGRLLDVGTQFEARLIDGGLEVHVREGRVALERDAGRLTIEAGQAFRVESSGARALEAETAAGPRWAWVQEVAPRMPIEGRSLSEFLAWYGRESGLAIRWGSGDLGADAARITLRGSIEDMTLDEALRSVLATSGWRATRSGSELLVEGR